MNREKMKFGISLVSPAKSLFSSALLPLLVFTMSIMATVVIWIILDDGIDRNIRHEVAAKSDCVTADIVKRLHDHEQLLLGGVGLFNADGEVTRDQWRRYVASLQLDQNHPGILGIGFSLWLKPEDVAANIRTVRAEGFPEYVIQPPGQRSAYSSIIYLEPFTWRNERAFGYDMYAETVRRAAMDKAANDGITTIASRIILLQETEKDQQIGILMYVPVYRRGLPTDTLEHRRAALKGFVYSPIRMKDFIYGTLGTIPTDVAFEVYDGETPQPDKLIFSSLDSEKITLPGAYQSKVTLTKKVKLYGRSWTIVYRSLPAIAQEFSRTSTTAVLIGGILISILLSVIAFILVTTRDKALTLAHTMTKELREQTEQLQLEVTQRHKAQELLQQQRHELEELNAGLEARVAAEVDNNREKERSLMQSEKMASLGQLAAGVALEINNPMSYITTNLRVLTDYFEKLVSFDRIRQEQGDPELATATRETIANSRKRLEVENILGDGVDLIKESLDGANRVMKIVLDLKSFFQIDAAKRQPMALNICLERALTIVQNELKYVATVHEEYAPVPEILCHPGQLNQLFLTLLVNAGKAVTPPGEIFVRCWREGDFVCASVRDTGKGMPEEVVAHIFEPFHTTRVAGQGTGLGLSISHEIIKKHHGELTVESTVGSGTTFTVRLPLTQV